MKISITCIQANVTQILQVVEQQLFNYYQQIKSSIPSEKELEKGKPITGWSELTQDQRNEFFAMEKRLSWIGEMNKEGRICTTESLVYKAFLTNDGVLHLPKTQGGDHAVITKLFEQ